MNRTKVNHRSCLIISFVLFYCIIFCISPSYCLSAANQQDKESNKPEQSAETRSAYEKYISAYNKLTSLMAEGKGNTPEAQAAYKAYKEAKDKYELFLNNDKKTGSTLPTGGNDSKYTDNHQNNDSTPSDPDAELREAYQQYVSAYNKLTSLMTGGKGDTPEAQAAYVVYEKAKTRYDRLNKGNVVETSSTMTLEDRKKQAYEDYMKAYNHYDFLISQGKSGTVEADKAFTDYNTKKAFYEKLVKEAGGTSQQQTSSVQAAYDKYIAAYNHLTQIVIETRISAPPDMKKLSDMYHDNLEKYNRTKDGNAYQAYIAAYNKLVSQAIKIKFTNPPSLKQAQEDYFDAKAEYERLINK